MTVIIIIGCLSWSCLFVSALEIPEIISPRPERRKPKVENLYFLNSDVQKNCLDFLSSIWALKICKETKKNGDTWQFNCEIFKSNWVSASPSRAGVSRPHWCVNNTNHLYGQSCKNKRIHKVLFCFQKRVSWLNFNPENSRWDQTIKRTFCFRKEIESWLSTYKRQPI